MSNEPVQNLLQLSTTGCVAEAPIEFIGLWEKLCNPDFKPLEFDRFKNEAGSNNFVLSPQRLHFFHYRKAHDNKFILKIL